MPKKHFIYFIIFLLFFAAFCGKGFSETGSLPVKLFQTGYCDIYYKDDDALDGFLWRISGKRFDFSFEEDKVVARLTVDRLVYRVQSILDMFPEDFFIRITLSSKYKKGLIAFYEYDSNSITVYADKVTDGILAHEMGHAIISSYFDTPLPSKMQEILSQYVDKYLWEDY